MHLIAGMRGATSGLMAEVIEDHVRAHLVEPRRQPRRRRGGAELLDVVRTYLK